MRIIPSLAAFSALLLSAGPALADITARFAQPDEPPMVAQVNDRGESRIEVADAVYLTTGGVTYMIVEDAQGRFVARQEDFLALMSELLAAFPADSPPAPAPLEIVERGTETLAGRTGTVFRISDPRRPSEPFDMVISTDPELAPLGRAVGSVIGPFSVTVSRAMPAFGAAVSELAGRGTLLRFGPLWRLERIEIAPVPESTFALPGAPLDRDALRARLRADAGPASR
jgi:hypothetical protein